MPANIKPRVLIFSLAYFPMVGGAEIAVKEITDRLSFPKSEVGVPTHFGVGIDFDLITLKFKKEHTNKETIGGVNVFRVGGGKLTFPLTAFFLARKLHQKNNYSVVWPIMAAYAGLGALLFKFWHPRVPMLLTLQEGDSESHILKRVGLFYPLWQLIFRKADYVQVISNYLGGFAKKFGARCPIEVVPNGVSLGAYGFNRSYRSDKTYTIITTSRLVYKNGVDILIRATSLLQTKNYQLKTIIVGDGPDRKTLERLSVQLGVADVVKFVGHVDPELIPQHLSQADIFVRPSRSEGLGNSFLEAMAAGLPVIGTSVGGIPDFLEDRKTGLFCEVDNPNDLAEKIQVLLSDDSLSDDLSRNGRELVEAKYSWDNIAPRMSSIFNKLLCQKY